MSELEKIAIEHKRYNKYIIGVPKEKKKKSREKKYFKE